MKFVKIRCRKCRKEGEIDPILVWVLEHPCGNVQVFDERRGVWVGGD